MNTSYKQKEEGFTIIEVVLVLAIAALIFLMVFIALPALQRNQRDTQRRTDLGRISTQITNYTSANRGKIPTETKMTEASTGFVARYLKGSGSIAGEDYLDPTTGTGYTFIPGSNPAVGQVHYETGVVCGDDGATATGQGRNFVLITKLEGQASPYCIDNRS